MLQRQPVGAASLKSTKTVRTYVYGYRICLRRRLEHRGPPLFVLPYMIVHKDYKLCHIVGYPANIPIYTLDAQIITPFYSQTHP